MKRKPAVKAQFGSENTIILKPNRLVVDIALPSCTICWISTTTSENKEHGLRRQVGSSSSSPGHTAFEEMRAPTLTSSVKPDLIAVRERRATVIDVSIVSDGRGATVWNEKKQKYGERQLLNDKNKTDPGNLGKSLAPVYQSVNPRMTPSEASGFVLLLIERQGYPGDDGQRNASISENVQRRLNLKIVLLVDGVNTLKSISAGFLQHYPWDNLTHLDRISTPYRPRQQESSVECHSSNAASLTTLLWKTWNESRIPAVLITSTIIAGSKRSEKLCGISLVTVASKVLFGIILCRQPSILSPQIISERNCDSSDHCTALTWFLRLMMLMNNYRERQMSSEEIDTRFGYFLQHNFVQTDVVQMFFKHPTILELSPVDADRQLASIQTVFQLSADELRKSVVAVPKLLLHPLGKTKDIYVVLSKMMGFSNEAVRQMVCQNATLLVTERNRLAQNFMFMHSRLNLPLERIQQWPTVLSSAPHLLSQRATFLFQELREEQENKGYSGKSCRKQSDNLDVNGTLCAECTRVACCIMCCLCRIQNSVNKKLDTVWIIDFQYGYVSGKKLYPVYNHFTTSRNNLVFSFRFRPLYTPLSEVVNGDDAQFCERFALVDEDQYNVFLKTL
ncbi:mTERF domain-containing protein mitochondrial [Clonorchis sinensis]|uniref:mTERF domain-containing protein mitochondrial n=1 Tax=Clonorchis sinensis TaxID=79923 RepID=G7YVF9_CLOSI|nr:mTERF domain-containing protein mitochondrial [Clonorchis sinensis]